MSGTEDAIAAAGLNGPLMVASASNPASVGGCIASVIRERGKCEIQAVGAGAVNQAVKAIAIARGYCAPSGVDIVCIPTFVDIKINSEDRTAMRFMVRPEHWAPSPWRCGPRWRS